MLVKDDGTWLRFKASSGKEALIHVENYADRHKKTVIWAALHEWCADQRSES